MPEARLDVRLRPRGHRDELIGMQGGVLHARVAAPPLDGRANRALCRLIAKRVGVAPSKVRVLHGKKSRDKVVEVEGIDAAGLERALG
jgi:uncharacterized protein (TIGR00251 family)